MRTLIISFLVVLVTATSASAQTATDSRYKRIELSFVSRHDNWELQNPDMSSKGIAAAFIMGRPITARPQIAIEYGGELSWTHYFKRENELQVYRQDFMWLSLPVVARYQFHLTDRLAISPLLGLNFKFNFIGNRRDKMEYYDNFKNQKVVNENRTNYLSREEEYPARIFQFGARAGVGLTFDKFYLGYTCKYDFTPYINEDKWDDNRLRTLTHLLSVGFQF